MDVHEALDAWQAQYSSQPPVGFMLRFTHEAVWTRVHYLRNSAEPATR
jgi:biotin operon repressor